MKAPLSSDPVSMPGLGVMIWRRITRDPTFEAPEPRNTEQDRRLSKSYTARYYRALDKLGCSAQVSI